MQGGAHTTSVTTATSKPRASALRTECAISGTRGLGSSACQTSAWVVPLWSWCPAVLHLRTQRNMSLYSQYMYYTSYLIQLFCCNSENAKTEQRWRISKKVITLHKTGHFVCCLWNSFSLCIIFAFCHNLISYFWKIKKQCCYRERNCVNQTNSHQWNHWLSQCLCPKL